MPFFCRDGLQFHYREAGAGVPFVFQHGLGGDTEQTFGLFRPPPGFRLLTLDCRAHGETRPLGDCDKIGIAAFADDLLAWLDHLRIERAVVGGISMGAAVALNFALRYPARLLGLVLSRPAWLHGARPENVRLFGEVARLIRAHGPATGRELFQQSEDYRRVLAESPDNAAGLLWQFEQPRAAETVVKLERVPTDTPNRDAAELRVIAVPTLVLANRQDVIHPFAYGEALAEAIRGAELHELTPKSVSKERHGEDVQRFVGDFLVRHFSGR
jgi:pimeloyl-ACP methyl ester carboxylesterase